MFNSEQNVEVSDIPKEILWCSPEGTPLAQCSIVPAIARLQVPSPP